MPVAKTFTVIRVAPGFIGMQQNAWDMKIRMDITLDPTLGCGQAHRWRKEGDVWTGVIGNEVVDMVQLPDGVEVRGSDRRSDIERYLGGEDDLDLIISEISEADPYVASLASECPGMRILRQEPWECLATYVLATNANVARIGKMVESVCDHFGTDLGRRHAFPTPGQILDGQEELPECRLGFREERFLILAERAESGDIDPYGMRELDYRECVTALKDIKGVGPKVADCVALFAFGHLNAFPVDARIEKVMESMYGITGSYAKVSGYGMERFGRYAGYAQEFLYHSKFIGQ